MNQHRFMNWDQARNLLRIAVLRRRESAHERVEPRNGVLVANDDSEQRGATANGREVPKPRAASLCVVSGKGGTGKSVLTSSLSTLLAKRGGTLIVDADLGVGNAHILQGVTPEHSFVEVADGTLSVSEIIQSCRPGLDLLSAGSGVSRMASLSAYELYLIASGIEQLETDYEFLLVDSAAGISAQTALFAAACDCVLLVTTPDLTAMTDAYAFLKVLYGRNQSAQVRLVVNRAHDKDEGRKTAARICAVADKFLGRKPEWIATLPEDGAVRRASNKRSAVVLSEPESEIAKDIKCLCASLMTDLIFDRADPAEGMGKRLVASSGYSNRMAAAARG
ncbi:MAG: flagellar biosynthesis protein FlhG [Planctomycetota bacterium]|jgi:flagellar biosynthesis protein FlhG